MVLIICTKNELNLTYRYWGMVPDRQKVRTEWTDGRRQNYIPPTSSGDNNMGLITRNPDFVVGADQLAYQTVWLAPLLFALLKEYLLILPHASCLFCMFCYNIQACQNISYVESE